MNDLLGSLADDNFVVEDSNAMYTPTPSSEPIEPTEDPPKEGDNPIEPQTPPVEPQPAEPTVPTEPQEPTSPSTPSEPAEPTEHNTVEPVDIDVNKTFTILKESGMLAVADDFEFTGETSQLGELITNSYDQWKTSARQELLEELGPEFSDIIKYKLTKGNEANLNEYISKITQTSNLEDIDLAVEDNQVEVVKTYLKKSTAFNDSKIEHQISLWKDAGLLQKEANESLTALLALDAQEKEQQQERFNNAISQRDEEARNARRQIEGIIQSADYIDTPRKNKVKAYINNIRQAKGQRPTTEFQRHLSMISGNAEHTIQLADLILDMYDPQTGFNYDRLNKRTSSQQVSSVRDKLDKLINASGPKAGGTPSESKNTFDWKAWARQTD